VGRLLAILLTIYGAVGCRDESPVMRPDVHGVYELARVDGQPIPETHALPDRCPIRFTSGSSMLRPDGSSEIAATYETLCPGAAPVGGCFGFVGIYTTNAQVIYFEGMMGDTAVRFVAQLNDGMLDVRFNDANQAAWGDLRIALGPREPLPPGPPQVSGSACSGMGSAETLR
jgi:hypothetical protein